MSDAAIMRALNIYHGLGGFKKNEQNHCQGLAQWQNLIIVSCIKEILKRIRDIGVPAVCSFETLSDTTNPLKFVGSALVDAAFPRGLRTKKA